MLIKIKAITSFYQKMPLDMFLTCVFQILALSGVHFKGTACEVILNLRFFVIKI